MNWSDLAVIAIILGFGLIGMINGFVLSVFRIVSFFLSVYISIKFYPVVANLLMKTALFENVKMFIFNGLLKRQAMETGSQAGQAAADTVVGSLSLPGFLKQSVLHQMDDASKLFDISKVIDSVSSQLAAIVINIISMVLLYVVLRVALAFLKIILRSIARLPLFRQLDRLGGFALGAVEGLLTVYVICTILTVLNSMPQLEPVFNAIDKSLLAGFFYNNNFIIRLLLVK